MSINTETQRLIQAKTELKTSIEKRGADVPADNTIDTFANILDACPFGISGTFIPEESTKTFSIEGLPFTPTSLMLICPEEVALGNNRHANNLVCASMPKGFYGHMLYTDAESTRFGNVKPESHVMQWRENGVSMLLPSSVEFYFNEGYVYNYYITGGVD